MSERMRMVFDLQRADDPPLYDELAQFRKGAKRLNRLKILAHEGLYRQHGWTGAGAAPQRDASKQPSATDDRTSALTEVFAPAIDEE